MQVESQKILTTFAFEAQTRHRREVVVRYSWMQREGALMDKDNLNRWLTLGANLGVLVGILLLILELDQTREMMRAQTRNEISVGIVDLMSQVATDPQLANLIRRADSGDNLTPDEYVQYNHRSAAMFRYFENVHYQYRQGLYDESEYSKQKDAWKEYFSNATTPVIWCNYRNTVSAEFMAEIDSLLTTDSC